MSNATRFNFDVHRSSETSEWSTPLDFFNHLDSIFTFTLDAAASAANAKCKRFFTKREDALKQQWEGRVWLNPPYGRVIGQFVRKAYESSLQGATVCCLLPARTDTLWWHRYARRGVIFHLRGRLRFGNSKTGAPFPSAVVIFFPGRLGECCRPYGDATSI